MNVNLRPTPWVEPPHPSVIRLYEDLIQVYRSMKENQREIDRVFDRVASQIGFVVTTTLPVRAEVESKGVVRSLEPDGEAIRHTLFGTEFTPFLAELKGQVFQDVSPGTYRFFLIWYDALLLKLQWDIYEPAQVLASLIDMITQPAEMAAAAVRPEVQEPAHWFDPRIALPVEDVLTISAVDAVYPELRLSERIAANRMSVRRIASHVMEPVHLVPGVREPAHYLQALVRPEVQERVHVPGLGSRESLLAELRNVLQKFGM
ncbi:MAG: hypothetical protein ABSH46_16430 [Bryobacteraceae bacterium]